MKKDEKLLTTIQQEYKILAEYKMIESEKLSGIYVIPSYANSLQWYGVFFGRCQGFYADSVFRFSFLLPDNFPDDKRLPTIIFQHNVVHPHICPLTHSMDISHAFSEWRSGEDHLWHILKYMQTIFSEPLESISNLTTEPINSTAAELLVNNPEEYTSRVKQCIEDNKTHIYDTPPTDDPHYIIFEKFQPEVHGVVLERIRTSKNGADSASLNEQPTNGGTATGLSWVKEGEFKPLSVE